MSAEFESEVELSSIREDLGAIRGCLLRSGIEDAQELAERLRSVVAKFRTWTTVGPVDRDSVAEIQRELGELQPLFENAYALHSGWFGLLDLEQSPGSGLYGANGQRMSASTPAANATGGSVYQQG